MEKITSSSSFLYIHTYIFCLFVYSACLNSLICGNIFFFFFGFIIELLKKEKEIVFHTLSQTQCVYIFFLLFFCLIFFLWNWFLGLIHLLIVAHDCRRVWAEFLVINFFFGWANWIIRLGCKQKWFSLGS